MGKRDRPVTAGVVKAGAVETGAKRQKLSDGFDARALADQLRSLADALQTVNSSSPLTTDDLEPSLKVKLIELNHSLTPVLKELSSSEGHRLFGNALSLITKFTTADIQKPFLPLPNILDPAIEAKALTHSGVVKTREEHQSYERMEWMGDAYLEVIAGTFIHQTFPLTPTGKCSQYREICIRNQVLAQYTVQYGLDKRARLPYEFTTGEKVKESIRVKVFGDLFEAWIGGIIISDPEQGIQRAVEFLRPLWARALEEHIRSEEKRTASGDTGSERAPKEALALAIVVPGVKLEYRDIIRKGPKHDRDHRIATFTVGCYLHGWGVTGKELGVGTDISKKVAGSKAAKAALANKKLMKLYGDMKMAFMEVQAQQQQVLQQAPQQPELPDIVDDLNVVED